MFLQPLDGSKNINHVQRNHQNQEDREQNAQRTPKSRSMQIGQRHIHDSHQTGLFHRAVVFFVELFEVLFATVRTDRTD